MGLKESKLAGYGGALLLLAVIVGGAATPGYSKASTIDGKRELFLKEGKKTPCAPTDEITELRREQVTKLNGKAIGGERLRSHYLVKCKYQVDGRTYDDEFETTYDPSPALGRDLSTTDLAEPSGRKGYRGVEGIAEAARDVRNRELDSMLMVTYLPKDPRRAMLGPLTLAFPVQNYSVPGVVFGLAALMIVSGVIVLLVARSKTRRPASYDE